MLAALEKISDSEPSSSGSEAEEDAQDTKKQKKEITVEVRPTLWLLPSSLMHRFRKAQPTCTFHEREEMKVHAFYGSKDASDAVQY